MTCKICGRNACTESFHSIEEQEEFETKPSRYVEINEESNFKDSDYECESCREEKPDVIERGNGYYCDDCWPIF